MSALIIGDLHNRWELADRALTRYRSEVTSVVFMGDYFDDFGDNVRDVRDMANWLK